MSGSISVFISHIGDEAALANSLKQWIENTFPDQVSVFVSSDLASIQAGDEWYDKIMEALSSADIFLVVCSPTSLERPWVNFETGVAAFREIPIIPVCHRGMSPGKLPQPLHRFQGIEISHLTMPKRLMTPIARMQNKKLHAMPEGDMLAAFRKASDATNEAKASSGIVSSDPASPTTRVLSATDRAREIAAQKRFDDETVKLLQNGNSAFHDAAMMLITELELRAASVASETGWEVKHGGDSHSEYVFYAEGYTFQLLPKNVYVNTAHNSSIRVRFFQGRLLSMVERGTLMVMEEPTELPGYELKLVRTQRLAWCWKFGDTVLANDDAADQIISSFVLLIERNASSTPNSSV